MSRYYGRKVDKNQPAIVKALRRLGFSVQPIHRLGAGVPDLLIGKWGENWLVELKDGNRPCDRVLTDAESKWHRMWRGQVLVAGTVDEIVRAVGVTGAGAETGEDA